MPTVGYVGSGLPVGSNDRIKVDQHLRALDHPEIYVAGDLASVVNRETGRVLPPLAQIALEEGETVAHNLLTEIEGRPLEPFVLKDRGLAVSVGGKSEWQISRVTRCKAGWRTRSKMRSSGSTGSR